MKSFDEISGSLSEAEADLVAAREALWLCYVDAGSDPSDGMPRDLTALIHAATDAVKQLRRDYEECPLPEELHQAEQEIARLRAEKEAAEHDAEKADKFVSKLHDVLWAYDGQPTGEQRDKRYAWNMARDEMNGIVWKLHDLLRKEASE